MTSRREPLLGGRGVLRVQDVAGQLGVRGDDLAGLIAREQLSGGVLLEDGTPWGLFADDLPSREHLLQLGVRARGEGEVDPYVQPAPPGRADPSAAGDTDW